jgi:hypothetical protein
VEASTAAAPTLASRPPTLSMPHCSPSGQPAHSSGGASAGRIDRVCPIPEAAHTPRIITRESSSVPQL